MTTRKRCLRSVCRSNSKVERALYEFLRNGDDDLIEPEEWPVHLDLELGIEEHKYLAHEIARWLQRNYRLRRKR